VPIGKQPTKWPQLNVKVSLLGLFVRIWTSGLW